MAGLSAAVALTRAGRAVTLHEAAPRAGGRCRSYDDPALGCVVDNGNHLLLSGNRAATAYLDTIGATHRMAGPGRPAFPFMDVSTGAAWVLRPSTGRLPAWIFNPSRRVPGTRPGDYLTLLRLLWPGARSVAEVLPRGALRRNLLEPLAVSALNTPVAEAHAPLLAAVLRETLAKGGQASIPLLPRASLAESLVDPALAWLRSRGAEIRLGSRVTAFGLGTPRLCELRTADGPIPLGIAESVILAVPPWVATDLVPGLIAPDEHQAILNVHFRLVGDTASPAIRQAGFCGLIGGTAEWLFLKPGHVSVTVSAANDRVDLTPEMIVGRVWPDVHRALALGDAPPPAYRVIKEKRATFAATARQDARRPGPRTRWSNLFLAGDWTSTGLPATIEGAVRSGDKAAALA